ncbi:MAG: hybrid sensor histidine kinase/response regulator [Desulfobacterales bacterium]|nr:hybrid sensor histidine kinase/response regulator [Desulfobacterales bacterium]
MNTQQPLNHNILIVDDVPENIQVLASTLKKEGNYHLAFAQNGKIALSLVKKNPFDLILLDIMMPEMDGFEVCKLLKNDPLTCGIPIIFLTAKTEQESIVQGFELGAMDYVTKPFNTAELLARVKTHLSLKDTQDALKRSEQSLREANAAKDKFFSIIAHDLKNPFSTLLNSSKMLLTYFDTYNDDKKKKFIQLIKESSENTYKLLDNLLQWSRIQTGKVSCQLKPVDISVIAIDTMQLLSHSAETKGIKLQSVIHEKTIVYADTNMITLIFRNLIANAIKFTPTGGKVSMDSKTVEGFEEISIMDTGIGISEKDQEMLFRIDIHFSKPGTSNERGTGLGLILCKEFIQQHGGRIWVVSEPGKGSQFMFRLPKVLTTNL